MESCKPNIIYILLDDMGYGDVSCLNPQSAFKTPNFDQMAKEGMRFTDAHASSAVCTPSRYSLLTGRYNWRSSRKSGVNGGYDKTIIEKGRVTVAEMLKRNGYNSTAIGKWHLGMDFATTPEYKPAKGFAICEGIDFSGEVKNTAVDYGFDYFYGIAGSLDMPPYVYVENNRVTATPDRYTRNMDKKAYWRVGPTGSDFNHTEVLPNFTSRVLSSIEDYSKDEKPFFLYYAMPAPHAPRLPSPEFIGKSGTNSYGDFVLMCDDIIGKIIKKTKQLGIEENTIIVMASDNGCARSVDLDELARCNHNPSYIFRGYKSDIYEGGHRIPLIIKWPAFIKQDTECNRIVCLSDFFATIAEYLGWEIPSDVAEDSVSNLSLWKNAKANEVREYLVHQSIDGSLSIRHGEYKLEMCPGSGGWSYPIPGEESPELPRYQLYNLKADIGERCNIIIEYPEIAKKLQAELKKEVLHGRSTPGEFQQNTGSDIWDAVRWITEDI